MASAATPQQKLQNVKDDIKQILQFYNLSKAERSSTDLTKDEKKAKADMLNLAEKRLNLGKLRFLKVLKEDFFVGNRDEAAQQLQDFISELD